MVSQYIDAIIIGVTIGLSLLGVGLLFYRRMGTLTHEVSNISNSVNSVENEVSKVELKQMEKALWRILWSISDGDQPMPGDSVTYSLEKSGIDVTISLASDLPSKSLTESLKYQVSESIRTGNILEYMFKNPDSDILDYIAIGDVEGLENIDIEEIDDIRDLLTLEDMGEVHVSTDGERLSQTQRLSTLFEEEIDSAIDETLSDMDEDELEKLYSEVDEYFENPDDNEIGPKMEKFARIYHQKFDDEIDEDEERVLYQLSPVKDEDYETEGSDVDQFKINLSEKITPGDITVVNFEFEEKVNIKSIVHNANNSEEIAEKEIELFGYEGIFSSSSPFELYYAISSTDFDKISELIDLLVEKMDEFNAMYDRQVSEFDNAVEHRLYYSKD